MSSLPNELIFQIVHESLNSCIAEYMEDRRQRSLSREFRITALSIARSSPALFEQVLSTVKELYAYCCEERYQRGRRREAHQCQRVPPSRRTAFRAPKWCADCVQQRIELQKISDVYTAVYQVYMSLSRLSKRNILI